MFYKPTIAGGYSETLDTKNELAQSKDDLRYHDPKPGENVFASAKRAKNTVGS